jgi:hypothetical protein
VAHQTELDAAIDAGEIPLIVARGLIVVGGTVAVHAVRGIIDACEHAHVFAEAAVAVRACDHARVWIGERGRVDAYDSAIVIARGASRVRAADRSQVIAEERAQVTALDDADVLCRDQSTVRAHGRARVEASGHARVWATDQATVRASMRASVRACDHVAVWADADVTVTGEGPDVVINRDGDEDRARVVATGQHLDGAELSQAAELVRSLGGLVRRESVFSTFPRTP